MRQCPTRRRINDDPDTSEDIVTYMSALPPGIIARYLTSLQRIERQAEATPELSLREPLLVLLKEMGCQAGRPNLLVAPEASAGQAGQPDIFVKDEPRLVGFVETKSVGTDLNRFLRSDRQGRRYRESLPNWVATDYHSFVFLREGEVVERAHVDDAQRLADAFVGFFSYAPPVVRSSRRLAQELARRARLIRQGLEGVLRAEPPGGPLRNVLNFYRQTDRKSVV